MNRSWEAASDEKREVMQLHLDTDELTLLEDTLLERVGAMSVQRRSAASVAGKADIEQGEPRYDDLLDKVLARDLRFDSDELEQVADLLGQQKCYLREEIARLQNSAMRYNLQQIMALVERILERIDEARAML